MEEKDRCVVCGDITPYPKDTSIEGRQHYVIGAGQLCAPCCKKLNKCDGDNCPAAYY